MENQYFTTSTLLNILGIQTISKEWKIKFENEIIEKLIFRYFNIRNFEISKYRSFCISKFWPPPEIATDNESYVHMDRGPNSESRNVERLKFWNFKIANIKITKDDLFDSFIF